MRKLTATVIKTYCLKWLFVFVTFFIAFIAQAQLVQKWAVNNPVSLPTSALPTIKDAVVIGADGNIVVSGKNTLTKLNPAGGQIWTTALTAFPAGYSANSMAIALDNSDNIYLTTIFVIAGMLRYLQITFVENNSGSPTKILYSDKFIIFTIIAWLASFYIIIYLPGLLK